jgi:hypothetical protein
MKDLFTSKKPPLINEIKKSRNQLIRKEIFPIKLSRWLLGLKGL